jgi:hypothetical protein
MQNLVDISSDDDATSPASATWACCACIYKNKASYLVCELCHTARSSTLPASDSKQPDKSGRWECEACTFMNATMVLCCEMCNQTRSSITDDANSKQTHASLKAAAAITTLCKPSESAAAAPVVAVEDKGKATAHNVDRERHESANYCSRCSGHFLSAHALQTHQCAHAPWRSGHGCSPTLRCRTQKAHL